VASTIGVEAAIFDTPVVDVAFDGESPVEPAKSVRRYYRFTHYANVMKRGAQRIAETPDALVGHVASYLLDPSLDREGRRLVVQDQVQFTDGKSSDRIARFVCEELADVAGRPARGRRTA
jgi:hypothetical protein